MAFGLDLLLLLLNDSQQFVHSTINWTILFLLLRCSFSSYCSRLQFFQYDSVIFYCEEAVNWEVVDNFKPLIFMKREFMLTAAPQQHSKHDYPKTFKVGWRTLQMHHLRRNRIDSEQAESQRWETAMFIVHMTQQLHQHNNLPDL